MKAKDGRGVFKHVLIATDGSALSNRAARAGISLAKALGAKVTAYHAVEGIRPLYLEGEAFDEAMMRDIDAHAETLGRKRVDAIRRIAETAGVTFRALVKTADTAYEGIIDAAKRQRCDVIFMASHGRRGLSRLLMGSVTQQVLTHSKIPVVVYR